MYNPSAHKHKDKQNVVFSYNGISFSYKKEWYTDKCYNVTEP